MVLNTSWTCVLLMIVDGTGRLQGAGDWWDQS